MVESPVYKIEPASHPDILEAMTDVGFGIYVLGHRLRSAEAVLDVAVQAEDLGFDSLWAGERLFYPGRQPDAPVGWDPLGTPTFYE